MCEVVISRCSNSVLRCCNSVKVFVQYPSSVMAYLSAPLLTSLVPANSTDSCFAVDLRSLMVLSVLLLVRKAQMSRPNTSWDVANMVKQQTSRNVTVLPSVGDSMRSMRLAVQAKHTVALILVGGPEPAGFSLVDLRPEALFRSSTDFRSPCSARRSGPPGRQRECLYAWCVPLGCLSSTLLGSPRRTLPY